MAKTNDSPNGHDYDEDLPEVLKIIDTFDNSSPGKQKKLIKRLRELATEYKDSPTVCEVCKQVADDLELRASNSLPHSTDTDEQV